MTPSFKGFHGVDMLDLNSMASMLESGLIEDGAQDIMSVAINMAAVGKTKGHNGDVLSNMQWQQVLEKQVQKKPPEEGGFLRSGQRVARPKVEIFIKDVRPGVVQTPWNARQC